jgi:hypothetical protein
MPDNGVTQTHVVDDIVSNWRVGKASRAAWSYFEVVKIALSIFLNRTGRCPPCEETRKRVSFG